VTNSEPRVASIAFDHSELIAQNEHYKFLIICHEGRWCGAALGAGTLFLFPEISEAHELGMRNKTEAVRRVGAIAGDVVQGFGGVGDWLAAPELLIDPEQVRCTCGLLYCEQEHNEPFFDEEPE
jgi:hypothetical protein